MKRFSLRTMLVGVMAIAAASAIVSLEYRRHMRARFMPLAEAVAAFNASAANDAVGRSQPALTSREVLTAIRRHLPAVAAQDAQAHRVLERIAATGEIPRNARFHFMTTYSTAQSTTAVWWINLDVSTDDASRLGYGLGIRENP